MGRLGLLFLLTELRGEVICVIGVRDRRDIESGNRTSVAHATMPEMCSNMRQVRDQSD